MKKIFLILSLMFIGIISVSANVDCKYTESIVLHFNDEGYFISAEQNLGLTNGIYSQTKGITVKVSNRFKEKQHISIKTSKQCPELYYCDYTNIVLRPQADSYIYVYYDIFTDSYDAEVNNFKCLGNWRGNYSSCSSYDDNMYYLGETYKLKDKTEYNKVKEATINFCNSTLAHFDYVNSCAKSCLNLYEDIEKIEKTAYTANDCGLSTEIVAWIINILRWVKYLIPVALIALSIVDFIKAIASEKEDDMKKAQKNFVTRLIVAVLVFIAPMIIEFVLDKLGFDATNCDIKNIGF